MILIARCYADGNLIKTAEVFSGDTMDDLWKQAFSWIGPSAQLAMDKTGSPKTVQMLFQFNHTNTESDSSRWMEIPTR